MGDTRFQTPYLRIKEAADPAAAIRALPDEAVIAALAAASRQQDPYLANVLATEALNRTAQKNAIIQTAGEGMYAVDREGRLTYLNPAAERMLRCTLADILTRHVHDAFTLSRPGDGVGALSEDPALAAMRRAATLHIEGTVFHRADGTSFPSSVTAAPILREGEVEGAVVIFSDITDRLRAEEALRKSEARRRAVMTSAPVVLFALDAQGAVLLCEGKGLRALGIRPDQVIGRSIFDLYAHNPGFLESVRQALRGDDFVSVDEVDGRYFEKHWAPMADEAGRSAGTICVSIDVTGRVRAERQRQEAEERHRSLFDLHPDGIGSTDMQGRILTVNAAMERMVGWRREELVGRRFRDLVAPEDRERVERVLTTLGTTTEGIEFKILGRGGRIVEVRGVAVPAVVGGEMVGYYGMVQDIGARKRAERELHESREQMRVIVNALSEAVLLFDREGRVVFANDAAISLAGRSREQIIDAVLDDPRWDPRTLEGEPIPPEALPVARVLATGDAVTGRVLSFRRPDGTRPIIRMNAVPIRDAEGQVTSVVLSYSDIAGEIRSEMRLHQREEAYRALAENSPDLILRVDHCLRLVHVNRALSAATGLPPEALLGKTISETGILGLHAALVEDRMQGVLRFGKHDSVDHSLAAAGEERLFEMRLVPEFAEPGRVRYVLGVSRDVTERKREEEALRHDNAELERRLEDGARELTEATADLRAVTALMEERLLEPLRGAEDALRGLESGEHGPLPSLAHDALARARDANAAAARAMERLIEMRQAASLDPRAARPLDLREVLASPACATRCSRALADRQARLETLLVDAPRVLAPPEALAALLGALISDLLAFASSAEPIVRVRCTASPGRPGWAVVDVSSNGRPYPAEVAGVLGAPEDEQAWRRALTEESDAAFRLAVARRAVRRMGGALSVAEAPGGGALVTLRLPTPPA